MWHRGHAEATSSGYDAIIAAEPWWNFKGPSILGYLFNSLCPPLDHQVLEIRSRSTFISSPQLLAGVTGLARSRYPNGINRMQLFLPWFPLLRQAGAILCISSTSHLPKIDDEGPEEGTLCLSSRSSAIYGLTFRNPLLLRLVSAVGWGNTAFVSWTSLSPPGAALHRKTPWWGLYL